MVKAAMIFSVAAVASGMEWAEYKQEFGKVYNGVDEDAKRAAIFEENKKLWGEHSSGAVLGATEFSDVTAAEFAAMPIRGLLGKGNGLPQVGVHEYNGETLAEAVDWTTKGAVTPVKNQGQCGSCWAFSTTGGIEGAYQVATGKLVSLSEQQFVDCDKVDAGCGGGLMDHGFAFAQGTAIATEASYAYTGVGGSCKRSFTTALPAGTVSGFKDVQKSASGLKSALNLHPVSVAIQADQPVFQQYKSGVIKSGCGTQLDHGVLAVGYDGNTIKVKNSWGASWGANGYVLMDASQCGVTTDPSYPTISAELKEEAVDAVWEAWKQEHGKVYNGDDEDTYRHGVFKATLAEAAKLQELNPDAEFGATKFSDMTKEEFKEQLTNYKPGDASAVEEMDLSHLPEEVAASKDWTGTATTPVKDQGQCGSCWAESAVEQIESDLMLSGASAVVLGVQELVDCTARGAGSRRGGCSGGNTGPAYDVVKALGGLERESSYPYTARDGTCKFNKAQAAVNIGGYQSVGRGSETAMKQYISASGPLSICVDANSWQSYRGGVLSSCGQSVDHCVQLVGYADNAWKVRNSWGASWGEAGHIRVAIGQNLCAISSEPTKVTGAHVLSAEVQV